MRIRRIGPVYLKKILIVILIRDRWSIETKLCHVREIVGGWRRSSPCFLEFYAKA